jgi:hypothetical protein
MHRLPFLIAKAARYLHHDVSSGDFEHCDWVREPRWAGVGLAICTGLVVTACVASTPTSRPPPSPQAPATLQKSTALADGAPQPGDATDAQFRFLRDRAEAGEAVDFGALRLAWLHGSAMKRDAQLGRLSSLREEMFAAMKKGGDPKIVLAKAREILDIAYVDLDAHKARRQACAILHEEPCAERGHAIEIGLLKSVVQSGNGRSCASGWRVVTVDEEYFILRMLDARLKKQTLVSEGNNRCDAMLVDRDGREQTLYFEVTEVLDAEARRLQVSR